MAEKKRIRQVYHDRIVLVFYEHRATCNIPHAQILLPERQEQLSLTLDVNVRGWVK